MKSVKRKIYTGFAIIAGVCMLSACGTEKKTSENKKSSKATEETQENTKKSKDFVSKDGKVELHFSDETWECTVDTENTKTFESEDGVINVIFVEGEGIAQTMVPDSTDAYQRMVNGGMADLAFEVIGFERADQGDEQIYKGTVHYTSETNPDKYVTHYGVYTADAGYTVTAVLFKEDTQLLEKVQETIYGIKVEK